MWRRAQTATVEFVPTAAGTSVVVSPSDRTTVVFEALVTALLVIMAVLLLVHFIYTAVVQRRLDGAFMLAFTAALAGVSVWSLDARYYRRHEVIVSEHRVVVRSIGLLGVRALLDVPVADVRAQYVEPEMGRRLSSVVLSSDATPRVARMWGLSAPDAAHLLKMIRETRSAAAV